MKLDLTGYVAAVKKVNMKKKRWQRVLSVLIAIVVFCTTYALILPAITLSKDTICGFEEHSHTEDCYSSDGSLICEIPEHKHVDSCYDKCLECGEVSGHKVNCSNYAAKCNCGAVNDLHNADCPAYVELTLYEKIMQCDTLRSCFNIINDNTDEVSSLTVDQIYSIEFKIQKIYANYDNVPKDELEAYNELLDMVVVLKTKLGIAVCECDKTPHTVDCPMYHSGEDASVYSGYVLTVKDDVFNTGCLIPVWQNENRPVGEITYTWYKAPFAPTAPAIESSVYTRSSHTAVSSYFAANNGVNVAIDKGGKCWYYVKATIIDAEGATTEVCSEPVWIKYSSQLENGGFNQPNIIDDTWANQDGPSPKLANYYQFNQDYECVLTPESAYNNGALWWKATKGNTIENSADQKVLHIELGSSQQLSSGQLTPHNVESGAAGTYQYAEINCEATAALYQDVLTGSGAKLFWSLYHRARYKTDFNGNPSYDVMAIVMAPTTMVHDIVDQEQLEQVLANPSAYNAAVVKIKSNNDQWYHYNSTMHTAATEAEFNAATTTSAYVVTPEKFEGGQYVVSEGEYLTRFFFVAISSVANLEQYWNNGVGNIRGGNLIDEVTFSSETPPALLEQHTLTINYIDETGRTLAPSERRNLYPDDTFSVDSPDITGYYLKNSAQATISGTMTVEDIVVDVVYVAGTTNVEVKKGVLSDALLQIVQTAQKRVLW